MPRKSLLTLIGVVVALATLSHFALKRPPAGKVAAVKTTRLAAPVSAGLPVRLTIPKINVDSTIGSLGITPAKDMEAPAGPLDVGWFRFGPHPGNEGNAVIAGHYGRWKGGGGSVFDNLGKLSKGDIVYVQDENGVTTSFMVRELKTYGRNDQPVEVFGVTNDSHLNLITCQGTWNEGQKSYSERLVVFTDKV